MSEFWAVTWIIIKYGLIIGVSLAIIAALIVVFHPIYITLKGRGSIKGQRGEAKFSYLFGLLRLRCIASFHTQDVWLEFWRFKKLLQRVSVKEDEIEAISEDKIDKIESSDQEGKSLEDFKEKSEEITEKPSESPKEEPVQTEIVQEKKTEEKPMETSSEDTIQKEETVEPPKENILEDVKESSDDSLQKEEIKDSAELADNIEKTEDNINEEEYKVEATPEQLAELQNILEEEEKKKEQQEELKQKKSKSSFNAKLRKFKKDFNRRYQQVKTNLVLLKQKWNSLWPVVKRFWNRGKKGFRFHEAYLKVEYSLDEHYLTGMLCGYLAPTVGFAKRYGLDFVPVPVFPNIPEAGVYSKASWQIDILPYKLIWAVTALLFEKNIYKEIYWLYKWKKAKKSKPRTEN